MPKNEIHLQNLRTITNTISTTEFKSASEELRLFMDEKGGMINGFFTLPDPHVKGFKLFFHFHDEYGLLADGDLQASAEAYLRRIGETKRADSLAVFKDLLSQVASSYSHQMTSLEGVAESYTEGYGMLEREEKPNITINFFDTLDNKIQALIGLYRDIAWHNTRKVWVLPENMREFNMSVYIFDASFYSTKVEFLPRYTNQDLMKINHTMLEYSYCTINETSGGMAFETLLRGNDEAVATNFIVDYTKVKTSHLFRNITGNTPINESTLAIATTAIADRLTLNNPIGEFGIFPNPNIRRPPIPLIPFTFIRPSGLNRDGSPVFG